MRFRFSIRMFLLTVALTCLLIVVAIKYSQKQAALFYFEQHRQYMLPVDPADGTRSEHEISDYFRRDPDHVIYLLDFLNDDNRVLRWQSAVTIGRFGGPECLPHLKDRLKTEDFDYTIERIQQAITRIAERNNETLQQVGNAG